MSSYVILKLDTEPPKIKIHAPRYTTNDVTNIITIEADEELSEYQDIYAIDSDGKRHEYIFRKEAYNKLVGEIQFSDYPVGMVGLYARLKDDVGNLSDLASANFEIKTSLNTVVAKAGDSSNVVSAFDVVDLTEVSDSINVNVNTRDIHSLTWRFLNGGKIMSKENVHLCGSTVRLVGEFFNFEGEPVDVSFTKVIIYNYKYEKLEEFMLTEANRIGVGKYFFNYVTESTPKTVIYEFSGELDGFPALDRNSFSTRFI